MVSNLRKQMSEAYWKLLAGRVGSITESMLIYSGIPELLSLHRMLHRPHCQNRWVGLKAHRWLKSMFIFYPHFISPSEIRIWDLSRTPWAGYSFQITGSHPFMAAVPALHFSFLFCFFFFHTNISSSQYLILFFFCDHDPWRLKE